MGWPRNPLKPLSKASCRFRPCFGYHDHDGTLSRNALPRDIGHHFILWGPRYAERLRIALEEDQIKGVQSLIMLEPRPWSGVPG